jgi:outer membrane scaffolding protein for murein synthesis (MipA/OmpV family)
MMGFRRGRHGVDSPTVSKFARIDDTETAGAFVEWEHVGEDPRYGESAVLMADYSLTDAPSGLGIVLRADARWPLIDSIDPGLIVDVEGDLSWSSRSYMQTYFGVSPANAAASGLPAYSASSGVSQVGVALSLDQFLSRHWSIGARSHYGRLLSSAADSPVTAIAGSPDQFYIGAVFGYVL